MNAPDTFASTNPFPGLRPFHEDEEHLFFGREKQVDTMVDKLAETHFLALVGTSGSGKSSLVNCGLRPALHRGWMPKAGTIWRIAQFRPGSNPIRMMAEALASDGVLYNGYKSEDFSLAEILESGLRTSKLGLVTAFEQARLGVNVNLLVVADQFEELFRYHKIGRSGSETPYGLGEEATAFVNLLLEVCEHTSLPIYVVVTMRSDFLGDCSQFFGLPEAINKGQYLVPRMSRDERRLAIVGPVGVAGAEIDAALATRLVNDVGDNPDQLSILQHALNRTWARWENQGERQGPLVLAHYEAIGTMAHALDQHAERAFAELDTDRKQRIGESIMKALTDWGTDARGTRRPTKLSTLCALAQASEAEVTNVIDVFRRPSRSFLMPPAREALDGEVVIDISHESLMRVWERLTTWGAEEARSAQMYRRIGEWALRWDKGDADLWRGPDLASAVAWRNREAPRPQWAERYGGRDELQLAMRFLDASEQAQRAAVAADEAKRQHQLRRAWRWVWGSGVVTLMLLAGILLYFTAYRWDYNAHYNSYVKLFGAPEGIGPLNAEQTKHRNISYKITTQGYLGPVVSMQAVNAVGQPVGGLPTGFEMSSSETIVSSETRWEYVYDNQGLIAYEVALDSNKQRLRSIIYSPSEQKVPASRNAYMITRGGALAPQVGSCAVFITYEYSKKGHEAQTLYLDQVGKPTAGRDDVFIFQRGFDRRGNETKLLSLWKDRRPMNDRAGNAEMRISRDDLGNVITAEAFDATGAPINLKIGGWQRQTYQYDVHGNLVEQVSWKADGSPSIGEDGCHRLRHTYEHGSLVQSGCLDQHGQPALTDGEGYAAWKFKYDNKNRVTEWTYYDKSGLPTERSDGAFRVTAGYDAAGNMTPIAFFAAEGEPTVVSGFHKQISTFDGGREVRTEYAGVDGKLVLRDEGYVAIERRYDSHGNEEQLTYLGIAGRPVRNKDKGFATKRASFDPCRRETESRYLDEYGKPILLKDGYAVIKKVYDEGNNVVEEAYLGEREQSIRSAHGYARVTRKFDRHRNIIEERYADEHGKPLLMKGIYARLTSRYDDHNMLVEHAYFGAREEPVPNGEGWARIRYVKNADGENIETEYFKPVRSEKDYAKLTRRYNDHNALVEEAYFGASGEPVPSDEGWARITYVNDERNRAIERAHFGVRGEPVMGKNERYHRAKRVLDERDNMLELAVFGTDGKPLAIASSDGKRCARFVSRFDANNKEVGSECFDAVGKRVR